MRPRVPLPYMSFAFHADHSTANRSGKMCTNLSLEGTSVILSSKTYLGCVFADCYAGGVIGAHSTA